MHATCWSDYLCPWCYLGQHRDGLFAELGVTVTHRPYELHPEIGPEGRRVRADGRLGLTFDRIEAGCAEVGMALRRPVRMSNTRRALATAELVRTRYAAAFPGLSPEPLRGAVRDRRPDRRCRRSRRTGHRRRRTRR